MHEIRKTTNIELARSRERSALKIKQEISKTKERAAVLKFKMEEERKKMKEEKKKQEEGMVLVRETFHKQQVEADKKMFAVKKNMKMKNERRGASLLLIKKK